VASAAHQLVADVEASSTAAALWHQASVHHGLSDSGAAASSSHTAAQHDQQHYADADEGALSTDAAHMSNNNALVLNSNSSSSSHHRDGTGYVGFSGGFGPRHLAEAIVVPDVDGRYGVVDAAETGVRAPTKEHSTRAVSLSRRPVITKARRIRLAAAASQAAEVLQSVSTPATALLHSQRVQQLQAEEALLNASLQRLKAERDLAKVRHTCDEELHNFRRGVEQRERAVLDAANPKNHRRASGSAVSSQTTVSTKPDPVVSYSQESGGGVGEAELGEMVEGDLLGMSATADAEAAAAAAMSSKREVTAARVRLHRQSRAKVSHAAARPSQAAHAKFPLRMKAKARVTAGVKAPQLQKKMSAKAVRASQKAKRKSPARGKEAPALAKKEKNRSALAKPQKQKNPPKSAAATCQTRQTKQPAKAPAKVQKAKKQPAKQVKKPAPVKKPAAQKMKQSKKGGKR
jgi:hypothetical protein